MAASCGAFLRRLLWFCALCTVRARAGSMLKSVGSMPKSVKAVMKAAQARVNEAHDQIKHHTELWNCKEDLEHFSSKWSPEKQKYCCALGMGCLGQSGSELTPTSAAAAGGGDAVADGLETHGGTGSSDGAAESRGTTVSPDSTTEDNSRTLTVEVGKPFAEKVEHESMMGTTYEAMAGSGGVWPSWLQFDPAQGRLYGIPAAVSEPMSVPIEVAKTTFSGGQFNHDTFRYKLVVVPAGAESTTLRTTTVVSTTDALTGAAATMLGISSPAATPGAKGGTAQGTSAATGASGSTGAGPSAGSAATPSPASAGTIKASSTAASEAAAAKRVTTSMAAASNLGAQAAAAQSTTGPPAAPTTSMVKLVPSDKEKAIAEELIQHEVPAKLATLGSVGHLPSPGYGGCIIQDAMCEPLDMNWSLEELGRKAEDAEDCQQQCRDKVNCACFTYYAHLKACHFGSAMSDVRKNTPGFVGGKAYCDDALQGLAPHTVTQIIRKRKCMSDVSFLPAMCTVRAPTTFLDDPVDCEHRCQDHDWCSSFAYSTLTKSCDLQCANATPIHAPVYTMSGPKICTLSLVLGMTLTCPWNFDYEAEKWAQVLVSGLVHVVAKIRTLGGSKANSLTAHDVGVSMDKPDNSADNSRSYQLHIDVNEHLAMYLYFLLKSKTTGSKFDEYTQNFTSNAAETVLKSQCHPKVSLDFVKKQVEGASFQKLAPLGQSLDLMNHSVQQYSARKAETTDGTKFGWLLMTVGSFMAVLALWMLPRWRVQFSKGQCIPSCEPRPEVDVRQAQVGVPLIDEDRLPSEDELRPQLMQIPQETDSLMV